MAEDKTSLVLEVESKQVTKAAKELDKLDREATGAEKATNKLSGSFKKLGAGVGIATAGLAAAAFATKKLLEPLAENEAAFQAIDKQLEFVTGSARAAAQELDFLRGVTAATGQITQEVAPLYARLRASMDGAGLSAETTRELFQGVAEAAGTFALSSADMNGLLNAFSQIASKGKVQAEELRGQIGERLPGAFSMAAKALGVTTQELNTMLDRGEVLASDLLPVMARELRNTFGPGIENRTNTLAANFNRLEEATDNLFLTITRKSPIGEAIQKSVTIGIDALNALEEKIRQLAGEETRSINELVESFDLLSDRMATLDRSDRGFASANRALREAREGLQAFSEAEIAVARLQNSLEELSAQEAALGAALQRRRRESQSDFLSRQEARQSELEAVTAEKAEIESKIALLEQEIARQKEADSVQQNRMASFTLLPGGSIVPELDTRSFQEANQIMLTEQQVAAQERFKQVLDSLMTEEEAIEDSYQRRMAIAKEYSKFTGESVAEIETRLAAQKQDELSRLNQQRWDTALSSFDDFQNNLLVLARTNSNKLAGVYKAAAIANTIIKTHESATSAYAALAPIPYVGPALGAAAAAAAIAAGLANVQAIQSQPVGGFAQGGIVPGTSFSGDALTANVNSGEMILNFPQQKKLFDVANGRQQPAQGQMQAPVVNVFTLPGETADARTNERGELEIFIRRAKEAVAGDLMSGTGSVNQGLDAALRRKGVA